jgi:hypothetical protein
MVMLPPGSPSPSILIVHVPDFSIFRYVVIAFPPVFMDVLYSIQLYDGVAPKMPVPETTEPGWSADPPAGAPEEPPDTVPAASAFPASAAVDGVVCDVHPASATAMITITMIPMLPV